MFSVIFVAYLSIRLQGFAHGNDEHFESSVTTAFDVLGCGAPVLIPRLAFNLMSENMLFIGLRSMMRDFLTLSALAVWSFLGFLLSIKWLHNDLYKVRNTFLAASKLMFLGFGHIQVDDLHLVWPRWHRH